MTSDEKLAAIKRWTFQFRIVCLNQGFLGSITVYRKAISADHTDYYDTEAEVIDAAYEMVNENLWIIVSQYI
jgi:hypothetical protein